MRSIARKHKAELKLHFPDKTIEFIADRASCLHARPLWFSPMGNRYGFIPVQLPYQTSITMSFSDRRVGPEVKSEKLELGKLGVITGTSLELGLSGLNTKIAKECGDTTEEDVLIAVLY